MPTLKDLLQRQPSQTYSRHKIYSSAGLYHIYSSGRLLYINT